jgi:alkylation response protein AidB-like acyl-CoA dehydrogenase
MLFQPSSTQAQVAQTARDFAQRRIQPVAAELDRTSRFPREILQELADLGLMGVNVSSDFGGSEGGVVAYSLAMTEIARACASTAVTMSVTNMVAEVISTFGTRDQSEEHVTKLTSGEYAAGSFALSEPDAGSDPGGMRTTATKVPGGYELNGPKQWITSGAYAGVMVVWARTGGTGTKGISCFLVKGGSPGLTVGKPEDKLGLRASNTVPLLFEKCFVPDEGLLGEIGGGFKIAMMALDGGRIGIASQACGIGLAALDTATAYARERRQFGKPIGDFQGVQWPLADSRVELDAARHLTLRAAWLKEQGRLFSQQAAMAKLYASEAGNRVCQRAVQVLGGNGYTREFSVERNLRDVRVTTIYEGTSEIQRTVIARSVLRG